MGLCELPGELQDQVIVNLHPSAAIALMQTNRHFHTSVSLHRLSIEVVEAFLDEKDLHIYNADDYFCYSCYRLKPKISFLSSQVEGKHGKNGTKAHERWCSKCLMARGLIRWEKLGLKGHTALRVLQGEQVAAANAIGAIEVLKSG